MAVTFCRSIARESEKLAHVLDHEPVVRRNVTPSAAIAETVGPGLEVGAPRSIVNSAVLLLAPINANPVVGLFQVPLLMKPRYVLTFAEERRQSVASQLPESLRTACRSTPSCWHFL